MMQHNPQNKLPNLPRAAINHLKALVDAIAPSIVRGSSRDIVQAHRAAKRSDGGGGASTHKRIGSSRRLLPHECDQIAAAWEKDASVIEISEFHGISREAVYAQLRLMGYDTTRGAERHRLISA